MIAILGSLVLVLYVFLPEFLFNALAFNFRKVTKVPSGRYGDVLSGAGAAFLPFFITEIASRRVWFIGHWPFPVQEAVAAKNADYRTLATALYSESYFHDHIAATWEAWGHIRLHQCRFLFWMYIALLLQSFCVILLTHYFGSLSRYSFYRVTFVRFFLTRVSHWEVLLTGFAFPPKDRPRVTVDALTTDDHLYTGDVADFFLRADGELSGLLLTDFKRFRFHELKEARKAGLDPDAADYWKEIPGANFYLPAEKIANLNIRYESREPELLLDVKKWMKEIDPGQSIVVTLESAADGESPEGEF